MSNTAYNAFVILFGFCFLGLPIILISLSTAPPGIDQFNSSIVMNTIDGDSSSAIFLDETAKISRQSAELWANLTTKDYLSNINNLSQLILNEQSFLQNASISDYGGFSKKVHLFILEMNITDIPASSVEIQNKYVELFGQNESGTFISYRFIPTAQLAYYHTETSYPDVNGTIHSVYSTFSSSLIYLVTVQFYAEIEINNTPMKTNFVRLLLLTNLGEVYFFLTNEIPWITGA